MKPELTVIILAGGTLADKSLGPAPPLWLHPLLLPAGSNLAIDAIRNFYEAGPLPVSLLVVIDELPPTTVPLRRFDKKQLLQITPQPHIMGTLKKALAVVETPWVLINPITTLPSHQAELSSQIVVGEQLLIRENWSALRYLEDGSWSFEGKKSPFNNLPSAPFSGIVSAPTVMMSKLAESITADYSTDLLVLAQSLIEQTGADVVAAPWHDLGHRTTYAASRRSRLPSRAFNQLHYCRQRDVIVKRSSDNARLAAERHYLQTLPASLSRHFPSILEGETNEQNALVMEAIPFPTLAELYLHWDLGPNSWIAILERLAAIQSDFSASTPTLIGSSRWLYGGKLRTRWNDFTNSEENRSIKDPWWERELCINGRWFKPLHLQVEDLLRALAPLERNSQLHWIHGDFCFNNILCDPLYTTIRLIDPRGETAPKSKLPSGYGDNRYDRVKLFHSIGSNYDAIVNNLFSVKWHGSEHVEIQTYSPNHQAFISKIFKEILWPKHISQHELYLLTASLFLSMLPLHGEDSQRQLGLAACGMDLLGLA